MADKLEERRHNHERPGPGWQWVQPDLERGGWWEKDHERRYPTIYAESEG